MLCPPEAQMALRNLSFRFEPRQSTTPQLFGVSTLGNAALYELDMLHVTMWHWKVLALMASAPFLCPSVGEAVLYYANHRHKGISSTSDGGYGIGSIRKARAQCDYAAM